MDLTEQYFVGVAELLENNSKFVLFGSSTNGRCKNNFWVRAASDIKEIVNFLFFFHGFVVHLLQVWNVEFHEDVFADVWVENLPLKLGHDFLLVEFIVWNKLICD